MTTATATRIQAMKNAPAYPVRRAVAVTVQRVHVVKFYLVGHPSRYFTAYVIAADVDRAKHKARKQIENVGHRVSSWHSIKAK